MQTATQVATKLAEQASYANMAQYLSNEVSETSEPSVTHCLMEGDAFIYSYTG